MVTRIKAIVDWFFKRKVFYRVCNHDTNQGLWYDYEGNFTGLIHDKFSWCQNSDLKMDYDSELCGYLSAVTSITDLFKWFSKEDITNVT